MSEPRQNGDLAAEVFELTGRVLDRDIEDQQEARLNELLATSDNARRLYVQFIQESAGLATWATSRALGFVPRETLDDNADDNADDDAGNEPLPVPALHAALQPEPQPTGRLVRVAQVWERTANHVQQSRGLRALLTILLTVTAAAVLIIWIRPNEGGPAGVPVPPAEGTSPKFVAALDRAFEPVWNETSDVRFAGVSLQPEQTIDIASGLVEIRYARGARVILQGPARFTIGSNANGGGTLEFGRLTARVPAAARGFQVDTELAQIVDLGTEFGLSVDPAGQVDVETFSGRVAVGWDRSPETGLPTNFQQLVAGETWRVGVDGASDTPPTETADYVREIPIHIQPEQYTLELGPAHYFRMDRNLNQPGTLSCAVTGRQAHWQSSESAIRWSIGRVGKAVTFSDGSYFQAESVATLRSDQPFSYGAWIKPKLGTQLTVLSKMRIAGPVRGYDLFINNDGRPMLHLLHSWPDSALRVDAQYPLATGEWQHLMATYDGSQKAAGVALYVNGKPIAVHAAEDRLTGSIEVDEPFLIGRRGIGGPQALICPFVGDIDELVVFNRQLSPVQVRGIVRGVYRTPRPRPQQTTSTPHPQVPQGEQQ